MTNNGISIVEEIDFDISDFERVATVVEVAPGRIVVSDKREGKHPLIIEPTSAGYSIIFGSGRFELSND